ncbi:lytic transglycosylase domain-containing protein [Sphingomonas sp. J344]|uniref:lytic transglycosylase domain-containing protein n=1 Tax=Sphingomonas sp. J344 TaxID=2898434 RepID=UPI002150954E|nr:lytic transglycosylase domain-containing protein [Sphingomonas sp. J344]MCR5869500.1 lytic transglycosylase domain-containing protein [Sphingomonas sp. J344]
MDDPPRSPPAPIDRADPVARWQAHIDEAAQRFGIPASWIVPVMRAESGGRTMLHGRPIRSNKGAIGLMQLMPGTWAELRVQLGLGTDPDDPRDNILAGAAYLRAMYDRFGYPGLFAAYNAGPARYAAHLRGKASLPAETRAYLAQVAGASAVAPTSRDGPRTSASEARPEPLFAVHRAAQDQVSSLRDGVGGRPKSRRPVCDPPR